MSILTIVQSSVALSDPHICSDFRDRRAILLAMFESLVQRDATGAYAPALAESWEQQPDARTWRFRLRTGVRCHNGDILTAADVVASLERVCDPALGGELGTQGVYLSYLAGSQFRALDQQMVEIVTAEPLADLLDLLVDMPIAPQRALANLPHHPVGSGPYRLVEATDGQLVMEAFHQHSAGRPRYDRLVWQAHPDPAIRAALLASGQADLATGLTPHGAAQVAVCGGSVARALSGLCVIAMLNIQHGPCHDVRVRQALNYALNVPALIAEVMHGEAEQLNGPLTRLHLAHNPATPPYAYDPARARTLLAEAGYASGLEVTFDLPLIHPDEAALLAERMASQWASAGIHARLIAYSDRPGYADMVRTRQNNDVCMFDSSPLSSLRVLREKIHSGLQGPWWQGYCNPTVDQLIDQASATIDTHQRQHLYQLAYRHICADAAWVFLYSPLLRIGLGPRLRGWQPRLDGLVRVGLP